MVRKGRNLKSLVKHVLERTPTLAGCLLLLCSVVSSFCSSYTIVPMTELHPEMDLHSMYIHTLGFSTFYCSFMSSNAYFSVWDLQVANVNVKKVFLDYWGTYLVDDFEFCVIVFSMFIFQILALVAAIASLFVFRRGLAVAPFMLCLLVIGLMISANAHLSAVYLSPISYEEGYLLSYLSMFLFLFGSVLILVMNRNKKTGPRDSVSFDQVQGLD